jgi:RNA polymerase sigma-70 factor (ECF subfamily)
VFTQLWRNASRYDPDRGTLTAWLSNITRSRALDVLRARKRRARVLEDASRSSDDDLALPLADVGPRPDAGIEMEETRRQVAESMRQLPDPQRQVLELAYFGGLSQSEIAARLNQPLGTIKTRTRAAMDKLREALSAFQEGRR